MIINFFKNKLWDPDYFFQKTFWLPATMTIEKFAHRNRIFQTSGWKFSFHGFVIAVRTWSQVLSTWKILEEKAACRLRWKSPNDHNKFSLWTAVVASCLWLFEWWDSHKDSLLDVSLWTHITSLSPIYLYSLSRLQEISFARKIFRI